MSGQMLNSNWMGELRPRLAALTFLVFAGLVKNAGKTTALNSINYLFSEQKIGLTSLGYDGEEKDAVYSHPKPPVSVHKGQLVLTAERFLPACGSFYEILDSWGGHPQFGAWLIVRVTGEGPFRMAGPVSLAEQKKGISQLIRWGAERILMDGALNRLSHISLLEGQNGRRGVILSTGAALGNSLDEVIKKTRHWLELFSLPGISEQGLNARPDIPREVPSLPTVPDRNAYFWEGKWFLLPSLLWEYKAGELLPPGIKVVYLAGALTDVLYLALKKAQRLPGEFIVRSPAHCLLSPQIWEGLRTRNIAVKLLERPSLVLLTLNPWHPLKPVSTERMAEALRPFCRVPMVDVEKQKVWLPHSEVRS